MTQHDMYDPRFFSRLWEVEDRHFWFRARNGAITALVASIVEDLDAGYRVLEVGCGTGNVLRHLERVCRRGHVIGLDLFHEGLRFARKRVTCPLVQADMQQPPFRTQFEVIGLFDVLEHLPDDLAVLRSLHALLAPGGTLLLTVPAHMSLWSYFDEASCHYRRYAPRELERKLLESGFEVAFLTPYMMSIFPLVWLGRRLAARGGKSAADLASNELKITPGLNALLARLLAIEVRVLSARRRLPTGTSLLAVGKRGA
jgi:SAM-dependent methyltransferase